MFQSCLLKVFGVIAVVVLAVLALRWFVFDVLHPPTQQVAAQAPTTVNSSVVTLPSDVVTEVPHKVRRGGLLKIFPQIMNTQADPLTASPLKVIEVPGLSLTKLPWNRFQETSGLFMVKQAGVYNFAVNDRVNHFAPQVTVRIDGQGLATYQGGSAQLGAGWHQVSLTLASPLDGSGIGLLWAPQGQVLQPLTVYREVR